MKLNRVIEDIQKTEEKIARWQAHLEELNIIKKQLEDAEIIKSIRSLQLDSREMLEFLADIKNRTLVAGNVADTAEESKELTETEEIKTAEHLIEQEREDRINENQE